MSDAFSERQGNARGAARDTMDAAQRAAGATLAHTRARAGEVGDELQDTAGRFADQMRDMAASLLDEQKDRAVDVVDGFAQALRRTAESLEREQNAAIGRYAAQAADQLDRLTGNLRQQRLGDIVASLEDFARRQPQLFLTGAVAAGFLVARMMASGTARRDGQREAIAGDGVGARGGRYGGSFGAAGQPLGGYNAPGSMERH